jgi:hypothetical protein
VCICFNCMQFEKFMCIAQLDVGYVTVCSAERTKAFSHVSWPDWVVGDVTLKDPQFSNPIHLSNYEQKYVNTKPIEEKNIVIPP